MCNWKASGGGRQLRWSMVGERRQIYHSTWSLTLWPVAMFFITIWISCTASWTQFSPWPAALLSTPTGINTIYTRLSTVSPVLVLIIWSNRTSVWTLSAVSSRVIIAVKYRQRCRFFLFEYDFIAMSGGRERWHCTFWYCCTSWCGSWADVDKPC